MATLPDPPPDASAANIPRGNPSSEGRFVWIASVVIERIINAFGLTHAAFAVAVYVALARLSSRDKNNPEIVATVAQIAGMANIGYRKTLETLHGLRRIGVLHFEESAPRKEAKRQPVNRYVLLSGRLPARKPRGIPEGSHRDCTRRTSSRAENPKDSPVRGESKEIREEALGGTDAAEDQSISSDPASLNPVRDGLPSFCNSGGGDQ